MSDDVLIRVEGVSKKFCRSLKKSLWYGLKDIASEAVGRNGGHGQLRTQEFWSVNDVSFELRRGECLGLIGRNGAGKTTLLKLLNGLIKPDKGRIEMRGRVGALIALGAGFNPILSGRENIYVNGSVLGLTKREIDAKIGEIIDFAEIGEFIDTPVQNYSSGMQVRLGFAVATALNPDILILDEVLAVGDIAFRVKCGNRIREIMSRSAVILVSHSMEFISWYATAAMVLNKGRVNALTSSVPEGIRVYESLNKASMVSSGRGGVEIISAQLSKDKDAGSDELLCYQPLDFLRLKISFVVSETNVGACMEVRVVDSSGQSVINYRVTKDDTGIHAVFNPGKHFIFLDLGPVELTGGRYNIMIEFHDHKRQIVFRRYEGILNFFVENEVITYTKVTKSARILQHQQ